MTEAQQILVTGDDEIGAHLQSRFEDGIILRVTADTTDTVGNFSPERVDQQLIHQRPHCPRIRPKLLNENADDLIADESGDCNLVLSEGANDNQIRRPAECERGDPDVGIEDDD